MKNRQQYLSIAFGLLLIMVMLTGVGWFVLFPAPLMVQGEVEATQVSVASKIFGRVDSLHFKEGDQVTKDAVLVSLHSPEIEAKMKQATAAKRAASAQKEKVDTGTRSEEIQAASSQWKTAEAQSEFATKTFERIAQLYEDGVVSLQQYDETEAKLKATQRQTEGAKAIYDMAVSGARIEDRDAATALVEQAVGAVSEVDAYLAETHLKSPLSGEIAEIIPAVGELVSPGYPIVNIVDLTDVWVTFNLREDLLAQIRMGSELHGSVPALGQRELVLRVNYINALGSYATWTSTKASGGFDMKTFEVRAVPVEATAGLRPGMSVLIEWEK